jgi:hypothetical protein
VVNYNEWMLACLERDGIHENLRRNARGAKARPPRRDWDALLDGTARELESGIDFDCTKVSLIGNIYQAARIGGLRVLVKPTEAGVAIQSLGAIAPKTT